MRIKVSLPESFVFSCVIPVRITDVNYGGHVGNDAILSILHEARLQFLKYYGYSEMDFGGTGLIMSDVAIEFKHEAFYGDVLTVHVALSDVQKVSFDICYKIEKQEGEKPVPVVLAKTGMVCFDYNSRRPAAFPETAKNKMIPQV
ncbi:MAG: thioesterase family protein [Niabella sp.]